MANYYAQVALQSKSGASRDVAINTFAIAHSGTPTTLDLDEWGTSLVAFYNDVYALDGLKGRAQTGHLIKFYRAVLTVPNYPVHDVTFTLAFDPAAVDLPNEVALAVSYANDSSPGIPRARRRGRIYLSGWSEDGNLNGRPIAARYEGLAAAYAEYVNGTNDIPDFTAGVWSRKDGAVYPVERVWCDNEWDTMRSRGGRATVRETILI